MQIAKHLAEAQQPYEPQLDDKARRIAGKPGPHSEAELARDAPSFPDKVLESRPEGFTTRDASGARWLNTGEFLIADIDFADLRGLDFQTSNDKDLAFLLACALPLWIWGTALAWQLYASSALLFLVMALLHFVIASIASLFLAGILLNSLQRVTPSPSEQIRERLLDFVAQNPDWHLRLYQTSDGARVLALHRTFDFHEPAVANFFQQMRIDQRYRQLCQSSRGFLARVSPRPWRLGLADFSVPCELERAELADAASRPSRIERYEQHARDYASCRYLESFGSSRMDPKAALVLAWHDELTRAENHSLPIA